MLYINTQHMLIDELKSLGLSDQEAAIYLACVELGPSSVLDIARKTKAHRTTVYNTVYSLLEKKLLSESVLGKRRVLVPEGANAFKNMLQSKLDRVDGIAGELLALSRESTTKPVVKFFMGVNGIKDVFRASVLETKEQVQYGIFTVEELMRSSDLLEFFLGEFSTLRKKHKISAKIIVADTPGGTKYKELDKEKFRETRLLPASSYSFPAEIMFHDNVVQLFVISETEQFCVTIESPAIAKTMKMIFNALWTQGY